MQVIRCVAQSGDVLGEGPCWDARSARLYWFDIKGRRLNWWDGQAAGSYTLPVRASVATPREAGGLLIVAENGLSNFDPLTGGLELVKAVEPLPEGFRSNDGKIDQNGRLWWSVMDDDGGKRPGFIYRHDADGGGGRMLDGVHIANSICSSPDGRTLYLADTARQTIFAFAMDPATGALGERRVFAHTQGTDAYPDGTAVDAEGFLWNAQWGAWRIVRYDPEGSIDRIVEVPVEQPSSCAFGGEDLSILYVTSARDGLSPQALEAQPLAGAMFAFEPGVKGLPLPLFAG